MEQKCATNRAGEQLTRGTLLCDYQAEEDHVTQHSHICQSQAEDTLNTRRYKLQTPFIVVQSLSRVGHFATLWTADHQASLSFTISWSLLKFMSIESLFSEVFFVATLE